ncbi:FecR family protein [Sphingobium sp. AP50]|nr:FecR family protein [Sphingobium sp. AP50]
MEEAAGWLAALDAGSVTPQAFEQWRAADPRHAVAFAQVAHAFEQVERLRAVEERPADPAPAPAINRRGMLRAGVLAGGASIAGALLAVRAAAREHAETAVGERRALVLDDGTRITLNTDSRISWRTDEKGSRVWLERGEIGLAVPAAPRGPLELEAEGARFRLGAGRFNARQQPESLDLLVLEGVADSMRGGQLKSGAMARVIGKTVAVLPADMVTLDRARSWNNGQLVFEGESLDFVVAEFNRYLDRKIVIADPALSRIRLGGRFTTTDPADLLTALHASFGIRSQRSANGAITLTAS